MQEAWLMRAHMQQPQFPEQQVHLKCPRCHSTNTKFCYYNNYNLSQPRHFCKNCRRYWTKGGTLRNIPVGGASRKNSKRSPSAAAKRPAAPPKESNDEMPKTKGDNFLGQFGNVLEAGGSLRLSPLLAGSDGGQFGNFSDDGSSLRMTDHLGHPGSGQNVDPRPQVLESDSFSNGGGFLNIDGGDGGCWSGGGGNGWPDLATYTTGSTFL